MKNRYYLYPLLCCCLLAGEGVLAQIPHLSPPGLVQQTVGNTTVTITYERPQARGRKVFGGLVPWGKPWRTGAGQCTTISFSQPVKVGGQSVSAGKYALVTIPGPEEWLVILNADTTLYSAKDHDAGRDVVRFRVRPGQAGRFYEAASFDIDLAGENAIVYFSWTNTQFSFPITTTTEGEAMAYIDQLLADPINPEVDYTYPAEFLFYARKDLNKALALTERQLAAREESWAYNLRRMIFEYLGHKDLALAEVRKAIAYRKAHPLDEQNQAWALEEWGRHLARLQED